LEHAIQRHTPQVGIFDITWQTYLKNSSPTTFLNELRVERSVVNKAPDVNTFQRELGQSSGDERETLILNYIERNVIAILNLSKSRKLNLRQGFLDLGMDSLTSVELKNRLSLDLGISLPATLAFDYPNVTALTKYILLKLDESSPQPLKARNTMTTEIDIETIERLSEQEAEDTLKQTLKDMGFNQA
jgi:acyl carrier protein